jgi:hypothetical protein
MHTRRGFLGIATGVGLYGFSSDFWNKKDPSEWSSQEIEQLTTKSPWAKDISVTAPPDYDRRGGGAAGAPPGGQSPGGQSPRIGGPINIPGIGGGGGMGGGRRGQGGGGAPVQSFKGTIRWESAKPMLDAMRSKVPEAFTSHYVIGVSGIPLSGSYQRSEDDSDSAVDRLKGVTFLEVRGKRDLQPGVVQQQTSSSGSVLFGFSKEMLTLAPDDREVLFTTTFGKLNLKAKFNLKEMMYRGELAV